MPLFFLNELKFKYENLLINFIIAKYFDCTLFCEYFSFSHGKFIYFIYDINIYTITLEED